MNEPRFLRLKVLTLSDTIIEFTDDFRVRLFSKTSGDTIDVELP